MTRGAVPVHIPHSIVWDRTWCSLLLTYAKSVLVVITHHIRIFNSFIVLIINFKRVDYGDISNGIFISSERSTILLSNE